MEFKSVTIVVYFIITFTDRIFQPINTAVIADFDRPHLNTWMNYNEIESISSHESHSNLQSIAFSFIRKREEILNSEAESSFGHDIELNANELRANKIIMNAKEMELQCGHRNPSHFNPAHHLFEVLGALNQSKLFKFIQQMPKGGNLHIHESAMVSTDFLVSLTYWPNLWQHGTYNNNTSSCTNCTRYGINAFRFSREQPPNNGNNDGDESQWRLVKDVRDEVGATNYDDYVRSLFTLYDKNTNPWLQFSDVNDVWTHFMKVFVTVRSLLAYMPSRRAYYKQALKELYDDGVQYVEIRAGFSDAYDLDANKYSIDEVVQMYVDVTEEFKRENPLFIGSKAIYAKTKVRNNELVAAYFDTFRQLQKKFPQFVIGFDLVGHEDMSPPLLSYLQQFLNIPKNIQLFFHAGETSWYGSVDENLIDAVLLGSRRIGHGYALPKHPKLMELVKSKNIAVEVSPVSNQVLKLVDDYRNHPATVLLAQNVPIVICSDDPSFWEALPLSHDFYMTFLGVASRHSDLRVLKKFAMNSIEYSSLVDSEKSEAMKKWQTKWDRFIADVVHSKE